MPLFVTAEDVSVETATTTTPRHNANSHDLIAALVLMAMDRGNKALNEQRKEKQMALNDELIHALEALPDDDNGDGAFAACQRFVGGYIHAFDDPGQPTPGVRLAGIDAVERGDKVHSACCSWSAAQDIQHESDAAKRRTAVDFGTLSFRELLVVHGRRVRARAPEAAATTAVEVKL
jgi:endonuclease YncB( thermonuclease family)